MTEKEQERENQRKKQVVGRLLHELDKLSEYYKNILEKLGTIADEFHKEGLYRLDTNHELPRVLRRELNLRGVCLQGDKNDWFE